MMLYPNPAYPPSQPPAINVPKVILLLIGVMVAVHCVRVFVLSDAQDLRFVVSMAFIPARLSYALQPSALMDILTAGSALDAMDGGLARYFLGDGSIIGSLAPHTFITYAFVHGDWMHLGVNALWLVAFGSPVARRFGPQRFLLFFAVTAIAGVALHYSLHRFDLAPVIGASAVVSGAMGAALRFMFQASGRGHAFAELATGAAWVQRAKALNLRQVLHDRRALSFMLLWFAINFIFGIAAVPLGISEASIAWEAHIGGFLAGLLLFSYFDPQGY